MNDGKSGTLSSDSSPKQTTSEYVETLGEFEARAASTQPGEWLETTPEIIKIITRGKGMGVHNGQPVEHLCYKGVIVCEKGKSAQIQGKMDEPMNNRLHGANEAKVISGR